MTFRDTSADITLDDANMENEFKKWAFDNNVTTLYPISYGAAKDAWNARQPEIDALKDEINQMRSGNHAMELENAQLEAENELLRNAMKSMPGWIGGEWADGIRTMMREAAMKDFSTTKKEE